MAGKVVAALYGPHADTIAGLAFQRKLTMLLDEVGLRPQEMHGQIDVTQLRESCAGEANATLVIGWGRTDPPAWGELFRRGLEEVPFAQFMGLDLYERVRTDGRALSRPRFGAGSFWSRRVRQGLWDRFLAGHVVHARTMYGLKRVQEPAKGRRADRRVAIAPGDPEEVAIVRFIFQKFAHEHLSRTAICRLLNAQRVAPPARGRAWHSAAVDRILTNDLYIGASRFRDCVKYDVFPGMIDKATFFLAQAHLSQVRLLRVRMTPGPDKFSQARSL